MTLFNNSRFYILTSSLLLSIATAAYLRIQIPSDQLYYIRTQQVFGFICILYWYLALIISPIGYAIGKQRIKHLEFARRAIGVSAAYFAVLHSAVALWGQLGGLNEIGLLPTQFKWSIAGGLVSLIVLLIMAATSLDKVISFMTLRRWKWLHRLVYGALILAVLHIWTIGTHLAYPGLQWLAFAMLVILSGLETFRVTKLFARKYPEFATKDYFWTLFLTIWIVWVVLIASIPSVVRNYHSNHVHSEGQHV